MQAWFRPIHTDSMLWLQPKVPLLHTDLKELKIYAITYFMLHIFYLIVITLLKSVFNFKFLFGQKSQIILNMNQPIKGSVVSG